MRCKIFYGCHSAAVEDEANHWLKENRIEPEQVIVRVLKMRHDNLNRPAFTLYYEVC